MVSIDFIRSALTAILTGFRYPHYVLLGSLLQEIGPLLATAAFQGDTENITAAGVFSALRQISTLAALCSS